MKPITSFRQNYYFLSNFYATPMEYDGVLYPSSEHAYQAAKAQDEGERDRFRVPTPEEARTAGWVYYGTPGAAKRQGRKLRSIRPDWDLVKVAVMLEILRAKFAPGTDLAQQLLATGDAELVEGNDWGDRFWGKVDGEGENHLGRLLMQVRAELRNVKWGG